MTDVKAHTFYNGMVLTDNVLTGTSRECSTLAELVLNNNKVTQSSTRIINRMFYGATIPTSAPWAPTTVLPTGQTKWDHTLLSTDHMPAVHVDLIVAATNQPSAKCRGDIDKTSKNLPATYFATTNAQKFYGHATGHSTFNTAGSKCTWMFHVAPS